MTNQIKKTQDDIRDKAKILKDIKKQSVITEDQKKNLVTTMMQEANMTEQEAIAHVDGVVSDKKEKAQNLIKKTRDGRKQEA